MTHLAAIVCLSVALHAAPVTVQIQRGYAARHDAMQTVIRNTHRPAAPCMFSSPTLPMGSWALILGRNTGAAVWCRVTDTSAPEDKARHIWQRLVAELDPEHHLIVCGFHEGRSRDCPVTVVRWG